MAASTRTPESQNPHRRRNLLTDEWVLVSAQRSNRPWQGAVQTSVFEQPAAYQPDCHLCPGNARVHGSINPNYSTTYVFDNDHPALNQQTGQANQTDPLFCSEPANGACRVICYSPDHGKTMAQMTRAEINNTIQCWQSEIETLGKRYTYVQLFENKGASMGCSSPHPHCQVWATSYLPSIPAREDTTQKQWHNIHGSSLLLDLAERESALGERVVECTPNWLAIVPYWASWPFETLLLPRFPVQKMSQLTAPQKNELCAILKALTIRYDNLFECSFPYSMGWHSAPYSQDQVEHWQLHAHFYPPLLRSATIKKFMVGFEMLAEAQRDLTPEQAAQRLRAVGPVHYRDTQ